MSKANDAAEVVDGGRKVSLAEMRAGESGVIVQIDGGHQLFRKLDALGIREGRNITKVSGQWMRGPVLLRQSSTQVALGFGMARRIFVQVPGKKGRR